MALSFKMLAASLVAVVLLLATSQEARVAWALEDDQAMPPDDMVPVTEEKPAEQVVVAIPGGAAGAIMAGLPRICLSCRCCSRSNPATCQRTNCCSSFNCDGRGKCALVQDKCGCSGCGGRPAPPAI